MTRFALALVAMMSPALASAEMITKTSAYSVTETVDRLTAAVEGAGATVFARIDHAKGAAKVGSDLRPTQMLMFGNPSLIRMIGAMPIVYLLPALALTTLYKRQHHLSLP